LKQAIRVIEQVVELSGRAARWLSFALVLVVSYEVMMRYVFNKPSMWPFDLSCMLGATVAAVGVSYAHLHRRHVKVDLLYIRLSDRGKSIIDVIGHLVFFLPFAILITVASINWMVESFATGEVSDLTGWYPPLGPLRLVVAIAFLFLLLVGIIQLIRDGYFLVNGRAYD
jgi:TRAP-type mannitol/chloroaromatic compound transport system permease small subunit